MPLVKISYFSGDGKEVEIQGLHTSDLYLKKLLKMPKYFVQK